MAGSISKTILIGNLGDDPTVKIMQSGDKVANFSVATSESWTEKSSGERKTRTEWHKCVVFNQGLMNVCENFLKKGSKVYIEGQNETRNWEKDGVKHYTTEVVLRPFRGEITMLDSFKESTQSKPEAQEDRNSGNAPQGSPTTRSRSESQPQGRGGYQDRRTREPVFA